MMLYGFSSGMFADLWWSILLKILRKSRNSAGPEQTFRPIESEDGRAFVWEIPQASASAAPSLQWPGFHGALNVIHEDTLKGPFSMFLFVTR